MLTTVLDRPIDRCDVQPARTVTRTATWPIDDAASGALLFCAIEFVVALSAVAVAWFGLPAPTF